MSFSAKTLLLICVLIGHNAVNEAIDSSTSPISKYAQMRQLFPTATRIETRQWRSADDFYNEQHPCNRKCIKNQPMTCYYYMIAHYDDAFNPSCKRYLDAKYRFKVGGKEYLDPFSVRNYKGFDDCKYVDGVATKIMVVNGQLPGQVLEVCEGDTIVADVINSMHETTTMHWHGILQRKTPHMDGVPHVSQYPIEPGQAFRYRFEADTSGTHWWHSHSMHQRGFGLAGSLIVRQPEKDNLHAKLYNFDNKEHVILIQDWLYNFDDSMPQNLIINGLGRNIQNVTTSPPTLYSAFTVMRGGRYRFRIIFNGITNCPVTMSIDNHDLIVISTDGNDIEPITVQKLTLHGGERYDFVLHANQEVGNYWLRVKGFNFCGLKKLHQEAILHYKGAPQQSLPKGAPSYEFEQRGLELNPVDQPPKPDRRHITVADLNALEARQEPASTPFRTYYTSMALVARSNGFLFQMDDITFESPKVSLMQTRNLGIGKLFCNKTQQATLGFDCRTRHCKCSNVIQVPAFKHVEFVVTSTSPTAHPIHLHGYSFRVVGMGVLGEGRIDKIEEIDRKTPLPRRIRNGPLKDTVQVPALGYVIFRYYTDNPGYWIFHCHISSHSENGMAAVIRVGDDMQMKMCPVSNCGLCSSVL